MAELKGVVKMKKAPGQGVTNGGFQMNEVNGSAHPGADANQDNQFGEFKSQITSMKRERSRILKNLAMISIAFLLNFTAFQNLSNLQSSLNRDRGLGLYGLSAIYGGLVVSCLFVPPILIRCLGCKWTMAVSLIPYGLYISANFYAIWPTIIPTSVLVGLGAAPLWAAKCTYLTESGVRFARLTEEKEEVVINRFFGIFFMVFQSAQIWGNLISAFILHDGTQHRSLGMGRSSRRYGYGSGASKCGAMFCSDRDSYNNTNMRRPDILKVYTLCGVYVALGILAFLTIALLVDKLDFIDEDPTVPRETSRRKRECSCKCSCGLLCATIGHLKHKGQILLIPITIYSGLEQAFLAGEYTKTFVSCALGIWMVGLVLICFGVANAICSVIFSRLVKSIGRLPIFILGAVTHCGIQIGLFFFHPSSKQLPVFFVIAGLWGVGDAVWQTQINSLYGCIFTNKPEAAFANYRLWESAGFIAAFVYSNFLCVYVKLYILLASLGVGMIGYFIVEYRQRYKQSHQLENVS